VTVAGAGRIRVRGLTRRFGSVVAVQPFDLDVGPGGVTGILGPNGSGKSTLLRMLIGLVPPDGGSTSVDGIPLTGDGTGIRRRVAYMPGEIALYGERKARAHLDWLLARRGAGARERARELADALELPLERRVRGYSHGMKRQLLLVAALAPQVRLRLLDEPTEGLDPSRRGRALELLAKDAAAGTTIVLSSHHLGEIERLCTRILFLRAGKLLSESEASELHEQARRVARIGFEHVPDAAVVAVLEAHGARNVRIESRRIGFLMPAGDPRATLRELLADPALPRPTSLSFGELSLQEIYRSIYGQEGV